MAGMKHMIIIATLLFGAAAYAAGTEESPDCDGNCPEENQDTVEAPARCKSTVRRYIDPDDPYQACRVRTCCRTTIVDGKPVTKCWDTMVDCKAINLFD